MEGRRLGKTSYRPSLHLLAQHFSVQSTIPYSDRNKEVPSFPPQPQFSVFERLSQRKREFSYIPGGSKLASNSPKSSIKRTATVPIEEELISWKRKSEEKLTQMRAESRARELQEVQPAPRINDLSRKIVDKINLERYGAEPKSIQIEVIPMSPPAVTSAPRTASRISPAPQPVPLVSPKRDMTQSEANMVRAMMLHGTPPNRGHLEIPAPGEEAVRKAALQNLRNQVLTRFSIREPEIPPDYTAMPFTERNLAFRQHRKNHLDQIADAEKARKSQECTFEPIFYARVPHHRQSNSTSELLRISQIRSPLSRGGSRNSLSRSQHYYEQYQKRLTETIRDFSASR